MCKSPFAYGGPSCRINGSPERLSDYSLDQGHDKQGDLPGVTIFNDFGEEFIADGIMFWPEFVICFR